MGVHLSYNEITVVNKRSPGSRSPYETKSRSNNNWEWSMATDFQPVFWSGWNFKWFWIYRLLFTIDCDWTLDSLSSLWIRWGASLHRHVSMFIILGSLASPVVNETTDQTSKRVNRELELSPPNQRSHALSLCNGINIHGHHQEENKNEKEEWMRTTGDGRTHWCQSKCNRNQKSFGSRGVSYCCKIPRKFTSWMKWRNEGEEKTPNGTRNKMQNLTPIRRKEQVLMNLRINTNKEMGIQFKSIRPRKKDLFF